MGDIAVIAAALLLLVFSLDSLAKLKQSEKKKKEYLKSTSGFLLSLPSLLSLINYGSSPEAIILRTACS